MKLVSGIQYNRKIRDKICPVFGCRHKRYTCNTKRGNKITSVYCPRHRRQHEKESNPLVYWFGILKQNARRRSKIFTLTLEDFRSFCEHTNYLRLKGKENGKWTIDCIDPKKGYVPGNIQILEHGQNCRKHHIDKMLYEKYGTCFPTPAILDEDDTFIPEHIEEKPSF